jgi:hypothetical protein
MKKIILILFCVITFFIYSFINSKQKDKGSSWIDIRYIECLKSKLPCECEKVIEYNSFMSIDTNSNSKNYGIVLNKYGQMEPYTYSIKKIESNRYNILNWNTDSVWANFLIQNDTLYFITDCVESKFIKSEIVKQYNIQHYYKDNTYLVSP